MKGVVRPEVASQNHTTLGQGMLHSLRDYWREAEPYQKFLYLVGALLVLSAVFHAGVLVSSGGSLGGDVSWRKPITFGESFGLTAISVAWVMTFLPIRPLAGWLLAGTLGVANFGEVLWVSFQQWRGVPSHFNDLTQFDANLFALAGLLILFTGAVIAVVTLAAFFTLQAPRSLTWAIRAGMALLVLGQLFGLLIIINDGPLFGAAGAMKMPHALALHGAQVLPLLGWLLLFTDWNEKRRTRTMIAAIIGYSLVVAVAAFQTLTGRAPLDLELLPAALLGTGGILLVGAYGTALLRLERKPAWASSGSPAGPKTAGP